MRVAIVGVYPEAEGKIFGGVQGVTGALGDGLAANGIEVYAVTSVPGLKKTIMRRTSTGVSVYTLPLFGKFGCVTHFIVDAHRIRRTLKEIKPDIVHVHGTLLYAHAALERGWPSILTMHGIYYREVILEHGWKNIQSRLGCRYEQDAVHRAKHICAINHYTVDCFKNCISTEDIHYINNPISDHYFDIEDKQEPGRLLFGGLIRDLKNVLFILEALALIVDRHPEIKLRIAGKVYEQDYYERCLAFVAERRLKKNVDFLGSLSTDQMELELSKASMLLMASKQENSPLIIAEAMAAGKAVIATPAGGTAEMVTHGETGLIVPFNDHEAYAESIEKLLDDPKMCKRMGKAGKAVAEENYKLSVVMKKTIAFYKDVIRGSKEEL